MADLKGTQTEKNLLTAFSGESQARNRYTYFARYPTSSLKLRTRKKNTPKDYSSCFRGVRLR
jgi:hypothetical protein